MTVHLRGDYGHIWKKVTTLVNERRAGEKYLVTHKTLESGYWKFMFFIGNEKKVEKNPLSEILVKWKQKHFWESFEGEAWFQEQIMITLMYEQWL